MSEHHAEPERGTPAHTALVDQSLATAREAVHRLIGNYRAARYMEPETNHNEHMIELTMGIMRIDDVETIAALTAYLIHMASNHSPIPYDEIVQRGFSEAVTRALMSEVIDAPCMDAFPFEHPVSTTIKIGDVERSATITCSLLDDVMYKILVAFEPPLKMCVEHGVRPVDEVEHPDCRWCTGSGYTLANDLNATRLETQ